MALNRSPVAIQVNGVALLIKGGSSDGALSGWQRVPGLANFTLPDETGSTNEVQLQDGSVAFAQIAGVGTITGSIGAVSGHPTHSFLAARRRDGRAITATIIRPAGDNAQVPNTANKVGAVGATGGFSKWTVDDADSQTGVKNTVREGLLVGIGLDSNTPPGPTHANVHPVLRVNADGTFFQTAPGPASDASKAASTSLYTRRPGIIYENLNVTVAGLGDGDFQAGGAVSSSITLQPSEALPALTVYSKTITELASDTTYGTAFADIT